MKIITRNLLLFAGLLFTYTLLIWSVFLLLHFILFLILRRRTIKGVHKTDIFE